MKVVKIEFNIYEVVVIYMALSFTKEVQEKRGKVTIPTKGEKEMETIDSLLEKLNIPISD